MVDCMQSILVYMLVFFLIINLRKDVLCILASATVLSVGSYKHWGHCCVCVCVCVCVCTCVCVRVRVRVRVWHHGTVYDCVWVSSSGTLAIGVPPAPPVQNYRLLCDLVHFVPTPSLYPETFSPQDSSQHVGYKKLVYCTFQTSHTSHLFPCLSPRLNR